MYKSVRDFNIMHKNVSYFWEGCTNFVEINVWYCLLREIVVLQLYHPKKKIYGKKFIMHDVYILYGYITYT
jgi:hypothetical protein